MPTASHMTSWSTWAAQSQGTSLVGGSRSSRMEGLYMKTVEPTVTTFSLTMEVEAVTRAIQWLASQHDAQITRAIILTDSMSLLQKVESGMGCPDRHTAMHNLQLQGLLWIYCPGHARVNGNEQADRLASTADITSGLQLGRAEVLRGLRNFPNIDRPEHDSTDRLKEWEVEKGSSRRSTLQGRERSVFNQTLALFWGQPWGDCWETGQSVFGPFRALWCHLELKLKLPTSLHTHNTVT